MTADTLWTQLAFALGSGFTHRRL